MGDHKHKKEHKKSSSSKRDHKESHSSSSGRDHKKHKKSSSSSKKEKQSEIDYSDPSLWVEAGNDSVAEVTPSEHLRNHQRASEARNQDPDQEMTESTASFPQEQDARHGWMLDGGLDFGAMGTARVKEEDKPKPNPDVVSRKGA